MDHPPTTGNAWAMTSDVFHLHDKSLNDQTEKVMRFGGKENMHN